MENDKIDSGDRPANEAAALRWSERYSPFAFDTLREIPWPTWALPFALLFMLPMWHEYEKRSLASAQMSSMELSGFVKEQRELGDDKAEVFITGSSAGYHAIDPEILGSKLSLRVGKAYVGNGTPWTSLRILKKYHRETSKVRLVVEDLCPEWFSRDEHLGFGAHFLTLREWHEIDFPNDVMQYSWAKRLLPLRFSLHALYDGEGYWAGRRSEFLTGNRRESWKSARRMNTLDPARIDDAHRLVEYCRQRGIHVVFVVTPKRENGPIRFGVLPEEDSRKLSDRRFLLLLDELDALPNCTVLRHRFVKDLIPECVEFPTLEKKYIKDHIHMTPAGAEKYTNWLADRLYREPAVVAAMKTPREKPVSFLYEMAFGKPVVVPEPAPEAPDITASLVENVVRVDWEEIPGATHYSVWRVNPDGTWSCLHANVTEPGYDDITAPTGRHFYAVRAHRGGVESPLSGAARVFFTKSVRAPEIEATVSSEGVQIRWDSVPLADCYSVWRYEADATWTCVQTDLRDSHFTEVPSTNGRHFYAVRAHRDEVESTLSNAAKVFFTKSVRAPEIEATVLSEGVQIRWNAIPQADHYSVWRYNADATWTCVQAEVRDLSFTDVPPTSGRHFYAVRTHAGEGESPLSAAVSTIVTDTMIASPSNESSLR